MQISCEMVSNAHVRQLTVTLTRNKDSVILRPKIEKRNNRPPFK